MKPGDRVLISAEWSSFRGRLGRVVALETRGPRVVLDGEDHLVPMAFEPHALVVLEDEPHVTAGE